MWEKKKNSGKWAPGSREPNEREPTKNSRAGRNKNGKVTPNGKKKHQPKFKKRCDGGGQRKRKKPDKVKVK